MNSVHLARFIVIATLTCGTNGVAGSARQRPRGDAVAMFRSPRPSASPPRPEPIPALAVINAQGAKLEGNQLTLRGVSPNSIVFADRPVRAANGRPCRRSGPGTGSLAQDPPNATVSVLGGGASVSDAVVTLKTAKLEGDSLVFDVAVLEGNLTAATGPAALFIDRFGWRGRALLGAAVGAAAASSYYPSLPRVPCRVSTVSLCSAMPAALRYYPCPPCY